MTNEDHVLEETLLLAEEFEATGVAEESPLGDPSIRTLVSGSGTITRFRIVGGKKEIIDELRPLKVPGNVEADGVGDLYVTAEFADRLLAKEPETVAKAAAFGVEAHVKFYRRFLPDRRKQVDDPEARDVPKGEHASFVSEQQADEAGTLRRKAMTRAAATLATSTPGEAQRLQEALGVSAPKVVLSKEEVAARQARHDEDRKTAGEAPEELDLPTETAGG